jgi:hypothetical protein
MFKIPRVNVIESDEGFSVEVLGRTGLKYIQGNNTLFIDSEILSGSIGFTVYISQTKKWDSGEMIDEETKQIIADNICRAFAFRGFKTHIL